MQVDLYSFPRSELLKKPVHDIQILMDSLMPVARMLDSRRNKKLNFVRSGKPVCYLVFEGRGLVCRSRDNLVIATSRAPCIIGLTSVLYPLNEEYYWRPETDALVMCVEADTVNQVVTEKNLWKNLAVILGFINYRLNEYNVKSTARTGISLINKQIRALMLEPIELRMKTGLANYILDRTLLSRSYVMKVVAELKAKNKIVLDGKILIQVNDLENDE